MSFRRHSYSPFWHWLRPLAIGFGLITLLPLNASAFSIDYSSDRDPALLVCDAHQWRGKSSEAGQCYGALLNGTNDPLMKAEAVWALGDLNQANQYFRLAAQEQPDSAKVRTRWGRLYIETYQEAEAVKLFREALQLDANYLPAQVGMAVALSTQYGEAVQDDLNRILELDPEQIEAYLLTAYFSLELRQFEIAETHLQAALSLIEEKQYPPLQVYALRAAEALLQGEDNSSWIAQALDYNPSWGEIHEVIGDFNLLTYRYRDAVTSFKQAVDIDPTLWSAHSKLGINLLRNNQVEEGRHHLEIAYSGDAFNIATVNTLRLLDTFHQYHVISGEAPLQADSTGDVYSVPVIWRLHEKERAVLEPYVRQLTQESIRTFAERYRFRPLEPIVVELYPNHDDFTVRTVSTPGVGLLGVTFGYLFAMDSPTASRQGDFHWGSVLWHEMAHVFTLSASDHKVPRWFSEGISMFEEWETGPSPGIKVPSYFLDALASQKLLPIDQLDSGFIRPTYEGQIMVSYVQAGLICQYISDEWGFDKLVDILYRFPQGDNVEEAISTVLGQPIDIIDDFFTTWLDTQFSEVIANIDQWNDIRTAMKKAWEAKVYDEVIKAADILIALYPGYAEEDSPYLYKALALDKQEKRTEAIETLSYYFEMGGHNAQGLSKLADFYIENQQSEAAASVLSALNLIIPQDLSVHSRLAPLLLELERPQEALTEYSVLLALGTHDRASAYLGKAKAYQQLEDTSQMRRQLLMALEIAPQFREAQQLLLELP